MGKSSENHATIKSPANFIDSFCDTSDVRANASRARKVRSATLSHIFMFALLFISLFPFHTLSCSVVLGCLAFVIGVRGALALTYRIGSLRSEKLWVVFYSLSTIACSMSWAALTLTVWITHGLGHITTITLLMLSAGFASLGGFGMLPDRALARTHVVASLLPIAAGFVFLGSYYQISAGILVYLFTLIQMMRAQTSVSNELLHRQEKYEALANAAQEIVVIHRDGIVIEVNPAFESEFGYTAQEIIGRHTIILAAAEEIANSEAVLRREEAGHRFATLMRKDGTTFKGEIYSRYFMYREQKCKMVCVQNITHRLEAEQLAQESTRKIEAVSLERSREAFESTRMKSEFVANMSHEIRTPLNAIIGMTELLGDTSPNDVQKRYLRTMSESSEHLLTLINDVLDFSKIDAGKLELEQLQFNITNVLESQADLLSSRAQQKGVTIVTSIDSDMPATLRGDAGRIGQILLNLIGNAIKFTNRGHIEVRAAAEKIQGVTAQVRFEVVDTGEGLAPGVAERLFRPFTQADSSTSRKHGGTGLGLSICKRLVEAMGGTIGVESVAGSGSKFWFSLPLVIIDADSVRTKFSRGDWSSKQIFVMTDENSSARSVGRYLQSWGLTATIGSSNWITGATGGRRIYDAVITSASFRRRSNFQFDGPVIEIQNEGGLSHDTAGAFASLTNPVRQSDLYKLILNALSLATPPTLAAVATAPMTSSASAVSDGVLRIDARVLVAEDNSTNQMLALAHLRKLGIGAHPVSNGVEALDALAQGSYDLVLMDCQMPEMDGFEATRRIRELEKRTGAHIPIVALTANAFEEDRKRCLAAGMDAYLAKPLRREQLVTILKQFLVRAA